MCVIQERCMMIVLMQFLFERRYPLRICEFKHTSGEAIFDQERSDIIAVNSCNLQSLPG